jgi:hypothetical protein
VLSLCEYLGSTPVFDGVRVAQFSVLSCVFVFCLSSSYTCILCARCCYSVFNQKFTMFLCGFVLLKVWFSVGYVVGRCLSFFFWQLYCLSFIDLRLWLLLWYLQTFLNTLFILPYYNDLYRILFQKSEATVYKSAWSSPIHFCSSGCA